MSSGMQQGHCLGFRVSGFHHRKDYVWPVILPFLTSIYSLPVLEPLPMSGSSAQQIDPDIESKRAEAAKMAWGGSNAESNTPTPPPSVPTVPTPLKVMSGHMY